MDSTTDLERIDFMPQTNEQATRADLQAKVEELAGLLIELLYITDPNEQKFERVVEMVIQKIKVLREALAKLNP